MGKSRRVEGQASASQALQRSEEPPKPAAAASIMAVLANLHHLQQNGVLQHLDSIIIDRLREEVEMKSLQEMYRTTTRLQSNQQAPRQCTCRKTRCLKLYCECFANGAFCSSCNCKDCRNSEEHLEQVRRSHPLDSCGFRRVRHTIDNLSAPMQVKAARAEILRRQPNAFDPKVSAFAWSSSLASPRVTCMSP